MNFFRKSMRFGVVLFVLSVFVLGLAALAGAGPLFSLRRLAIVLLIPVLLGTAFFLYRQAERICRQHQRAEAECRVINTFLAQLFNAAVDGMRVIARDYTLLYANESFARMAGTTTEGLAGRKCHDVFPDSRCRTPECLLDQVEKGAERVQYETVLSQPGTGELRNCRITAIPFHDQEGNLAGILEIWRDITEQVQDEAAMQQAMEEAHKLAEEVVATNVHIRSQQKELVRTHARLKQTQAQILQQEKMASIGQLAAGVAHEINNPMSFIASNLHSLAKYLDRLVGYLRSLEGNVSPAMDEEMQALRGKLKIDYIAEDSQRLVQESLEGADRVKTIVQGLRSFSRIDQAQRIEADINECLESTINIIWNELKYKCEVKKEYGDLPPMVCNPQQLNQVFMNILLNAAQSMETQGVIRIRTWAENGWAHIAISDTGNGIPREMISRIFEPFFTTKEVGKGTGLGLSIVYDIVKKHDGDIQVESEVGKGTTFTVRIPLVEKSE